MDECGGSQPAHTMPTFTGREPRLGVSALDQGLAYLLLAEGPCPDHHPSLKHVHLLHL